jgi:hypothetical protein
MSKEMTVSFNDIVASVARDSDENEEASTKD